MDYDRRVEAAHFVIDNIIRGNFPEARQTPDEAMGRAIESLATVGTFDKHYRVGSLYLEMQEATPTLARKILEQIDSDAAGKLAQILLLELNFGFPQFKSARELLVSVGITYTGQDKDLLKRYLDACYMLATEESMKCIDRIEGIIDGEKTLLLPRPNSG